MSSTAIATMTKMMEPLPEPVQDRVVEHLREYLQDLQDEVQWDALLKETQSQLVAAARRARQEIAQGLAEPMVIRSRGFGLAGTTTMSASSRESAGDNTRARK
jgi:hypothetical protein